MPLFVSERASSMLMHGIVGEVRVKAGCCDIKFVVVPANAECQRCASNVISCLELTRRVSALEVVSDSFGN
jgi:hypothetical protein